MCLPFSNLNVDYLITIIKSELSVRYKLSLVGSVVRRMWWGHTRLLQELKIAFIFYWNRVYPKTPRTKAGREAYQTKGRVDEN